jgi:hypothetical protein
MPSANQVRPGKWNVHDVLFDDGMYSVITGEYEGRPCLGERWNGDDGSLGFPNAFGNPSWHVVPPFLERYVLHGILAELSRHPGRENAREQIDCTLRALGKLRDT